MKKLSATILCAVLTASMLTSCTNTTITTESGSTDKTSSATQAASDENATASATEGEVTSALESEAASAAESSPETTETTQQPEPSADLLDGYNKLSQIEMGMTEAEVKEILGEPREINKAYYYFDLTVNNATCEAQVWINTTSGKVTYKFLDCSGEDYFEAFIDENTDFSRIDDIENEIIKTYEECAEAFKSPGYLISLDEDGRTTYLWVGKNTSHLLVSFGKDGNVKSFTGLV